METLTLDNFITLVMRTHMHFLGNEITPMSNMAFPFGLMLLILIDVLQGRCPRKLMTEKMLEPEMVDAPSRVVGGQRPLISPFSLYSRPNGCQEMNHLPIRPVRGLILPVWVCVIALALGGTSAAQAQTDPPLRYPSIEGYGGVFALPDPIAPSQGTRLIVDLAGRSHPADQVHPALERVARLVNLYGWAGIPPEQLDLAVVVHGPALSVVLDDAGHRRFFGGSNPNRELIQRLDAVGVKLMVCGQALMHRGYGVDHLQPEVELALSAITTLAEYQKRGYGVLNF